MSDAAKAIIAAYYTAFNASDPAGMLACVSDDIEHRVNEGGVRRGRKAFAEFCGHMGVTYRENLGDIIIFTNPEGNRAAAEFTVNGTYLQTDPGLPEAKGQIYTLPAGAFFDLNSGRITRVTTFYNLADFLRQVAA